MATRPTHEQAQLHLQVYEMRREAKMRQARDWFFRNYFPENLDDAMRIAPPGSEAGAFVMMVCSYWDQACALLNYGLLHEDLFFETNGEFYGVWDRFKANIQQGRERFSNKLFLATWKRPRSGTKPGLRVARQAISPPCASSRNRCARKWKSGIRQQPVSLNLRFLISTE